MQYIENIHLSEDFLAILARYLKMETSADENQLVEEWLLQSPDNATVLLNINQLLSGSAQNDIKIDLDKAWEKIEAGIGTNSKSKVVAGRRFFNQKIWKVAASIIIILTAAILYKYIDNGSSVNYYKGFASIQLKDGTKVELQQNAELILQNKYNKNNREVTLIGNGSFDVSKDSTKPFIIHLDNRILTVLGTAFSITQNVTNNYFNVKVTDGVVKVKDSSSNNIYKLIAGQELLLSNTSKEVKIAKPFEALKFNDVAFANILHTMEKVYKIKFVNNISDLDQVAYTIDLSSEPLEKALQTLSTLAGITIERKSDSIYTIK
jgi:ferric-dicitrate binding protein FerR (iron transport regulator)